jgi:hypothetical protein
MLNNRWRKEVISTPLQKVHSKTKICIYQTIARRIIMAKPIELELTLEGKDAETFQKYIDNPTYPKEGLQLIREAKELAESMKL